MTEYHIWSHFSPFQINTQFSFFFTKWPLTAILHVRPKITFDPISRHLRSMSNFKKKLFAKWLPAAILDDRKSLLITFLAISDQYTTFIFFEFFVQNQMAARDPFDWPKITFDRISCHFWSIRNLDQYAKIYRDLPL